MLEPTNADKYATSLEEIAKLNKLVELRETEIAELEQANNVQQTEISQKDKDISDYQDLMRSYSIGTGQQDALQALVDAREFYLSRWVLQEFGVDNDKSRATRTFADRRAELEDKTDIFAILAEATELDKDKYWEDKCREQTAWSEKLQEDIDLLKQSTISVSDHNARIAELNEAAKDTTDDTDSETDEMIETGKLALRESRNRALVAYLSYAKSQELKRHTITPVLERLSKGSDLSLLHEQTSGYWELANRRMASWTEQEKLVLEDLELRQLYLKYAALR